MISVSLVQYIESAPEPVKHWRELFAELRADLAGFLPMSVQASPDSRVELVSSLQPSDSPAP